MTTDEHPNVIALREGYGDMTRFTAMLSPEIVVHSNGSRGIAAGDWVGRDAVVQRMADLWTRSGESYVMTVESIVANDAFGCVLAHLTAGHPDGRTMDIQICGVWRFENRLLVEHWENCDDWSAFDNFFEPERVDV